MKKLKVALPKTHWSANEFIALFDAVINAKTNEEAEAAAKELKRQRALLETNQQAIQGGPHHEN